MADRSSAVRSAETKNSHRVNSGAKRRAENTPSAGSAEDPVKDCPKDCRYLGKGTRMKTCDYLLITGVTRGCEVRPGGCDRYEKNGGQADEKL
ncbi:hypothetical protein D1155_10885 [Anaerotruncus sp. 80]|uniref:Uncharacterized protein n=1 Tax=Anaerotruncus colihominis TaxID=169435 RepID=A0A845QKM0_9FIRM|nr:MULTISPECIES: hypothetical protein [Clostridia]NBH62156.1 hypothetical protein [Anaerotruncus colihominis]NCE99642.1 hypothetical protein [Emergencia sp. 1XD21-10]NCF02811.1 hypothetical protein [Anaerotruncus sp. 80]